MSISAYLSARSEKLGSKTPASIALWTLIAFIVVGFIPLIPYVFALGSFQLSCLMTGFAFLSIGVVKGYLSHTSMLLSGLQTLGLGTVAAIIAYAVGAWLAGL